MGFFSKKEKEEEIPSLPKFDSPRPFTNSSDFSDNNPQQGFPSTQDLQQENQNNLDSGEGVGNNSLPYPPQNSNTQDNFPQENTPQNHSLPSFPSSSFGDDVNQNLIKDAVGNQEQEGYVDSQVPQNQDFQNQPNNFNPYPNNAPGYQEPLNNNQNNFHQVGGISQGMQQPVFKTIESPNYQMPESGQGNVDVRTFQPNSARIKDSPARSPENQRVETLFIQLDNFEKTISTFNEIKLKVSEIESLLKSIKDVKRKEEEKLANWENEIINIKNNLDEIDRNFFNI